MLYLCRAESFYLMYSIMRLRFIFVSLLFLLAMVIWENGLFGQSRLQYIDASLSLNQPVGFFGRKVPNLRAGGQLGFLSQLSPGSPLLIGGELSYFSLGRRRARLLEWIDFREVEVDYSTTSSMLGMAAKCRFYPGVHAHNVDVFLEAFAGAKWLFTHTTATLTEQTDVSDGFFEQGSLSPSYGAAAGLNLMISETFFVQSRLQYLPGLSTRYYIPAEGSQAVTSSLDLFRLTSSTTDVLRFDLGIFIKLENQNHDGSN
jgi:hypothetical protein